MHPLVSTQWLYEHQDDPQLVILDVRGHILPASEPLPHYFSHEAEYRESHIPGARFVDWVRDITIGGPAKMQVAPAEQYAAQMSRLGVSDGTLVVAYDDFGGIFAARVWWTLNYYGHTQAAVLDGGWLAWTAEGRPATDLVPTVEPTTFVARPDPRIRRTKDQVFSALGSATRLIDVRSPAEYRAEASRARRKGRIPGAASLPAKEELTVLGKLIAPDTIRAKFEAAGVQHGGEDIVIYCNSGVSSSLGLLAYRAAGFSGGAVYDGSWKEWGNDDSLPIE